MPTLPHNVLVNIILKEIINNLRGFNHEKIAVKYYFINGLCTSQTQNLT